MAQNLVVIDNPDWQAPCVVRQELRGSDSVMGTGLSLLLILGLIGSVALAAVGLWVFFSWLLDRAAVETGSYIIGFMRDLTGR